MFLCYFKDFMVNKSKTPILFVSCHLYADKCIFATLSDVYVQRNKITHGKSETIFYHKNFNKKDFKIETLKFTYIYK